MRNKILAVVGVLFILFNVGLFEVRIITRLERIAVAIEAQNAIAARLAIVEINDKEQERAMRTLGMIARAELEAAKELNERMKRGR